MTFLCSNACIHNQVKFLNTMSIAIAVLWRGFLFGLPQILFSSYLFYLALKQHASYLSLNTSWHYIWGFFFCFWMLTVAKNYFSVQANYFLNSGWICSIILSREIFWKLNLEKNHRKRRCQQSVFSASAVSRLHRLRLNSTLTVSIFRPTLQLCRDWNSLNEKDNKCFSPRRGICCWIEIHMEKNPKQSKFKASAWYRTRIWTHTLYFLHECLNH